MWNTFSLEPVEPQEKPKKSEASDTSAISWTDTQLNIGLSKKTTFRNPKQF